MFVFLFLTYFTLYRLEVYPPHYNWLKIHFFLWLSNIPFIYVPQLLYPLICQWTSRLLSYPGYHKYCCNEQCVFWIMVFSGICQIMRFLGHMVVLFLVFWIISILFSTVTVSIYIPSNSAEGFPFLHILSSIYCL